MSEEKVYSILSCLPNPNQKVVCFGHSTFCCKEDMEPIPGWHKVTFELKVSEYSLKNEFPIDLEESILKNYVVKEVWNMSDQRKVIGVTKWMLIPNPKKECWEYRDGIRTCTFCGTPETYPPHYNCCDSWR